MDHENYYFSVGGPKLLNILKTLENYFFAIKQTWGDAIVCVLHFVVGFRFFVNFSVSACFCFVFVFIFSNFDNLFIHVLFSNAKFSLPRKPS